MQCFLAANPGAQLADFVRCVATRAGCYLWLFLGSSSLLSICLVGWLSRWHQVNGAADCGCCRWHSPRDWIEGPQGGQLSTRMADEGNPIIQFAIPNLRAV